MEVLLLFLILLAIAAPATLKEIGEAAGCLGRFLLIILAFVVAFGGLAAIAPNGFGDIWFGIMILLWSGLIGCVTILHDQILKQATNDAPHLSRHSHPYRGHTEYDARSEGRPVLADGVLLAG
jgi:hypothetical protein